MHNHGTQAWRTANCQRCMQHASGVERERCHIGRQTSSLSELLMRKWMEGATLHSRPPACFCQRRRRGRDRIFRRKGSHGGQSERRRRHRHRRTTEPRKEAKRKVRSGESKFRSRQTAMKIEPRKDSKAVARRCSGRQLHLVMQGAGSIIIHTNILN